MEKGWQMRNVEKMKEKKKLKSTEEQHRCMTSNFNKKNHLQLFPDLFSVLIDRWRSPVKSTLVSSGIELLGRCFVIGCCGKFGVSQGIAPFILLLHAVGEEDQEENSREESKHSACYHCCREHKGISKCYIFLSGDGTDVILYRYRAQYSCHSLIGHQTDRADPYSSWTWAHCNLT